MAQYSHIRPQLHQLGDLFPTFVHVLQAFIIQILGHPTPCRVDPWPGDFGAPPRVSTRIASLRAALETWSIGRKLQQIILNLSWLGQSDLPFCPMLV